MSWDPSKNLKAQQGHCTPETFSSICNTDRFVFLAWHPAQCQFMKSTDLTVFADFSKGFCAALLPYAGPPQSPQWPWSEWRLRTCEKERCCHSCTVTKFCICSACTVWELYEVFQCFLLLSTKSGIYFAVRKSMEHWQTLETFSVGHKILDQQHAIVGEENGLIWKSWRWMYPDTEHRNQSGETLNIAVMRGCSQEYKKKATLPS